MIDQPMTTNQGIEQYFFRASAEDFKKIPGSPVPYWIGENMRKAFDNGIQLEKYAKPGVGLQTGDNEKFIRYWNEVDFKQIGFNFSNSEDARNSENCWFPYTKGDEFRKWFGNNLWIIDWKNDGEEIKNHAGSYPRNKSKYFKEGIAYSNISSGSFASRFTEKGFIFDQKGSMFFDEVPNGTKIVACFLHSDCGTSLLKLMCPTLDFNPGTLSNVPVLLPDLSSIDKVFNSSVEIAKADWNNYETSWDFTENPLIRQKQPSLPIVPTLQRGNADSDAPASRNAGALPDASPRQSVETIKAAFEQWQTQNRTAIAEMQRLEEENNRLFIEAYGLQDELTPEVPEDQITLTRADQEKDIQRLLSYAIGCMMGRYSLDEPGLIYANAGNVDFDPSRYPSFAADEDGILPLTDQEWFKDDATNRFREFLLAVSGEDSLQQNLEFVAESLTLSSFKVKKGEISLDTVRRYLSNQFYKDHLQTYKKRPQLQDASSAEATRIKKDIQALEKKQTELRQFDDKLKHYADMRIKIDLDDGVKVNYGKFGDLLAEVKAVTGGAE